MARVAELPENSPLVVMDREETGSVPADFVARSMDGVERRQLTAVEAAVADREVRAAMAPAETESARMVSAARSMDGAAPLRPTALALAQALLHPLLPLLELAEMAPAETESARMVSAAHSMDGAAPLRLTVVEAVVAVVLVSVTGPCVRRAPSATTGAAVLRTRTAS